MGIRRTPDGKLRGAVEVKCDFYLARKLGAVMPPEVPMGSGTWGWDHGTLWWTFYGWDAEIVRAG